MIDFKELLSYYYNVIKRKEINIMSIIGNTTLKTGTILTGSQAKIAKKEDIEPKDQFISGSTQETPDFLQIPRKYKHSTLVPINVRDYYTGEVTTTYYEKPSLFETFKENITDDVKKVTTSVVDGAKMGGIAAWGICLMGLGPLGPIVGVPAAVIGGTAGAVFGLLTAPFNGHGL